MKSDFLRTILRKSKALQIKNRYHDNWVYVTEMDFNSTVDCELANITPNYLRNVFPSTTTAKIIVSDLYANSVTTYKIQVYVFILRHLKVIHCLIQILY